MAIFILYYIEKNTCTFRFNFDKSRMNKQVIFLPTITLFQRFVHGSFPRHTKSRLIAYSCTGHRWTGRYFELAISGYISPLEKARRFVLNRTTKEQRRERNWREEGWGEIGGGELPRVSCLDNLTVSRE